MKTINLHNELSKPMFYGLLMFFITMNLLVTYGATFFGPEKYGIGIFCISRYYNPFNWFIYT